MNAKLTFAVAVRVSRQLRRDRRTVVLLLLIPALLIALMRWVFDGREQTFQRIGVPLIGIYPLVMMFLVSSITMLRERTGGTLERMMTMPIGKLDILAGYALAFGGIAVLQVGIAATVAFGLLGLESEGPVLSIVILATVNALLGVALGLFVSAFARTEFQAMQFMPVIVMPQFLLCGLIAPRETMAAPLEWISRVLPMSYAYDALTLVARGQGWKGDVLQDTLVVFAFAAAALAAGAATLPRRTP